MTDKIIMRGEKQKTHAISRITAMRIDPDHLTEIVFQEHKTNRSLDQNALYWKWMTIFGASLGYTKNGMHRTMMEEHLEPILVQTPKGMREEYTTKKLKVREMSAYLENISITAGQMGVPLSWPEDFKRETTK